MQYVSQAYKTSMKRSLRNRGYIQVSFGIFDEAAQSAASFTHPINEYIYYSNDTRVFDGGTDDFVYATLENNFMKVDGSQSFLPLPEHNNMLKNSGVVSNALVNDGNVGMTIRLSAPATWYGLTINFGENYPTEFDIVAGGETIQIHENNQRIYVCDESFTNVDEIYIHFWEMKNSNTRGRIYGIQFGIGYLFGNDSVMDSTLSREISPISEFLPQFDFSVTLKNFDRYFDVNNPNSAFNFLSTDSELTVRYGYELDTGAIEWVPGQTLRICEWESDNKTATIRAQDFLRDLNGEYSGGTYDADGKTYAELAEIIFDAAGITNYYLDPVLSDYTSNIPLPPISYKEALQLIANACGCTVTFSRTGRIELRKFDTSILLSAFRMEHGDMLSYPKAVKRDPVKTIVVPYRHWFKNGTETQILSEEIQVAANEERTYNFTDPSYNYKVKINNTETPSAIVDSSDYYVTIKFASAGTVSVDLFGTPYGIVKRDAYLTVGTIGKTVVWDNPVIGGSLAAYNVGEWLRDYYQAALEYEYDTRGNPELDVGDHIFQDDYYNSILDVYVTEYRLNFRQSFSGHVKTIKAVSS